MVNKEIAVWQTVLLFAPVPQRLPEQGARQPSWDPDDLVVDHFNHGLFVVSVIQV